jgi:hypothetical protein
MSAIAPWLGQCECCPSSIQAEWTAKLSNELAQNIQPSTPDEWDFVLLLLWSAALIGQTTAPSKGAPFTRTHNSLSGTMNSVEPHSKQTASFGNTHTIGFSKPLSPGKWMAISLLNEL